MVQLHTLTQYMDALLEPSKYQDYGLNGLQVDSGTAEVKTVAYAVDSGLSIIEKAIKAEAQLLIVHHGLLWGEPNLPVTGTYGKKVSQLIRAGTSLYASHLPLDGNLEVGNAAELLRLLKFGAIEPFSRHKGATIGAKGRIQKPIPLDEIVQTLTTLHNGYAPFVLPFGKKNISTVGIATGSGGSALFECSELGIDLLISGEEKQQNYHEAKELGISAVFAGHYATETHGVRALANRLATQFGVKAIFIDEPTGI